MLIMDNYFDVVCKESSIHHFCPNNTVSKYQLVKLLQSEFRPDITVKKTISQNNPVSRRLDTKYNSIKRIFDYNRPMKRAIEELAIELSF
jgi:hypothetical protein